MDEYLRVNIKSSFYLQCYLASLGLLSLLAIWLAALPLLVQALLTALCVLTWRRAYYVARTLKFNAIVFRQDQWFVEKQGEACDKSDTKPVFFCPSSIATAKIISLHIKNGQAKNETILLLPDSSDSHSLRRLRVLLLNKPLAV